MRNKGREQPKGQKRFNKINEKFDERIKRWNGDPSVGAIGKQDLDENRDNYVIRKKLIKIISKKVTS